MIQLICQKYYENLCKYNAIENFDYTQINGPNEFLTTLTANTQKKQKIYQEQNQLIESLFSILDEKDFTVDDSAYEILNGFTKNLSQSVLDLDNEIAYEINRRLFQSGEKIRDYNRMVESFFWCGISEWKYSTIDPEDFSCRSFEKMNQYGPYFGNLKKEVRRYYIAGIINQILLYTHKEAGPLIQKGKEILELLNQIETTYPDTPVNFKAYRSVVYRNIATATDSFRRHIDDTWENRMYVYEAAVKSFELIRELQDTTVPFESQYYYDLYTAQFHIGKIGEEEFLNLLESICIPREEYSEKENFCCVFRNSAFYIEYVQNIYPKESKEAYRKIRTRVNDVVKYVSTVKRNEESAAVNRYIFKFIEVTINILPFLTLREILFKLMMNQHKQTCIHNLMVEMVSGEILRGVIKNCPQKLCGVCGYQTTGEIVRHQKELVEIMRNMALIHDLGKYKCISLISNGSRKITDTEFNIIKRHPETGYQMIKGAQIPEAIKEGILYHHRWHDGAGGYPQGCPQTVNQPLIDILSVADSLDAATDCYGRSYAKEKTIQAVIEEMKDQPKRYANFVVSVLENKETKQKVGYALNQKRDQLYRYVCKKQYDKILKNYPEEIRLEVLYS